MEKQNGNFSKKVELFFENFLWNTRYLVLMAVITAVISAFILFAVGIYEVLHLLFEFGSGGTYKDFYSKVVAVTVASIDIFLIATFLLVFAFGLYELFISKIDPAEENPLGKKVLVIQNLDDLKEKLGRLVIMVLIVAFFKQALHMQYSSPLDVIYIAIGVLLISLALYFTHKRD